MSLYVCLCMGKIKLNMVFNLKYMLTAEYMHMNTRLHNSKFVYTNVTADTYISTHPYMKK